MSESWTAEKNSRRCDLIDIEIDCRLQLPEKLELEVLQAEMLAHRNAKHPLPIREARELLETLKQKAVSDE